MINFVISRSNCWFLIDIVFISNGKFTCHDLFFKNEQPLPVQNKEGISKAYFVSLHVILVIFVDLFHLD